MATRIWGRGRGPFDDLVEGGDVAGGGVGRGRGDGVDGDHRPHRRRRGPHAAGAGAAGGSGGRRGSGGRCDARRPAAGLGRRSGPPGDPSRVGRRPRSGGRLGRGPRLRSAGPGRPAGGLGRGPGVDRAPAPPAGVGGPLGHGRDRAGGHHRDVAPAQPSGAPRVGGGLGQGHPERLRRRVALVRVGGDRAHHHARDRPRQARGDVGQGDRLLEHVPVQQGQGVAVVLERQAAADQLVEHDPGGVDVGGRGQLLGLGLLRRHVGRRAEHLARPGGHRLRPADDLGDPEVGDLQRPRGREHDVLRLDVAVQHAPAVGEVQRGARGHAPRPRPRRR